MLFFTGIQSWLQKIGRIFLLIINLDEEVRNLELRNLEIINYSISANMDKNSF